MRMVVHQGFYCSRLGLPKLFEKYARFVNFQELHRYLLKRATSLQLAHHRSRSFRARSKHNESVFFKIIIVNRVSHVAG